MNVTQPGADVPLIGKKPKGLNKKSPEGNTALGDRALVLARVAAAIANGSDDSTYCLLAADAVVAHVPAEEIVGTLMAVAPVVGTSALVDAAPRVARAIGYDIDAALEVYEGR